MLMHQDETSQTLLNRALENHADHPASKWDPKSYGIGAQILRDIGVGKMCLIGTARKMPSMAGFGLEIVGYCSSKETK
ncbi:MAG: hypothetical protein A3J99_06540 [Sideroxydans sp. RIFOXYD2_FULL_59_7]|nr:MAG: hypothetical protein A3J99_06540 [Sideroxydans sp. RIFOXYD2_FULL_59_7]